MRWRYRELSSLTSGYSRNPEAFPRVLARRAEFSATFLEHIPLSQELVRPCAKALFANLSSLRLIEKATERLIILPKPLRVRGKFVHELLKSEFRSHQTLRTFRNQLDAMLFPDNVTSKKKPPPRLAALQSCWELLLQEYHDPRLSHTM